jgi:DNA-binding response OmpR family regulator
MKTAVLCIEDDPNILIGLRELLEGDGFVVETCTRGDEACTMANRVNPGLIVLDVMLPGLSGFDVCKQLRAAGTRTPILMLTAKGQEIDKVIGLELGADDYLTKPFGVRELLARVHALLRRATPTTGTPNLQEFSIGDSVIDPKRFELRRGSEVSEITPKELKLLELFHAHPGEVLSRDRLLNEVWGIQYYGTTRALDQVIVQLRRKLGENGQPTHLITVHGVGYKLVP